MQGGCGSQNELSKKQFEKIRTAIDKDEVEVLSKFNAKHSNTLQHATYQGAPCYFLCYATITRSLKCCVFLIDVVGIYVDCEHIFGRTTPLRYAIIEGELEIVEFLLLRGAKLENVSHDLPIYSSTMMKKVECRSAVACWISMTRSSYKNSVRRIIGKDMCFLIAQEINQLQNCWTLSEETKRKMHNKVN